MDDVTKISSFNSKENTEIYKTEQERKSRDHPRRIDVVWGALTSQREGVKQLLFRQNSQPATENLGKSSL